jgi:fructose-bisphosphate aldolase class 1
MNGQRLVAGGKSLLAMDESNGTCNKRFASVGIPQTQEARRAYRELIVTTPGLGESISGAILYDETIRQRTKDGRLSFARAIQHPTLDIWHGQDTNVPAARQALAHRANCNRAANHGEYGAAMERK